MKVKYMMCDICGKMINFDCIDSSVVRLWNKFMSGLDICEDCMKKIGHIKNDMKSEHETLDYIFDHIPEEYKENIDMEVAFIAGVEMAMDQLYKNKIRKEK